MFLHTEMGGVRAGPLTSGGHRSLLGPTECGGSDASAGGREGEKSTTHREEALQPRDWTVHSQHQPVSPVPSDDPTPASGSAGRGLSREAETSHSCCAYPHSRPQKPRAATRSDTC